jgi:hypothetical protein
MRALSLAAVILAVALPCSLAVDAMVGGSKCHPKYEDQKTFMVMLKKNDAGEGMSAFVSFIFLAFVFGPLSLFSAPSWFR